ncbi:MAG TPA: hypothetical protein VM553_12720, partial [Dongiaceae bacterium]|nr:hypothetical protein [Dongiaceae bacterium]
YLTDGVQKARALVQDLRDVSTAATFDDIRGGATKFSDNLKAAGDLINEDAGRAMEALTRVTEAMGEAVFEYEEGGEPTYIYTAENGLQINVTHDDSNVPHYSFDDTVVVSDGEIDHDVAVTLSGIGHMTVEDGSSSGTTNGLPSETTTTTIDADFNLTGAVSTGAATLTIRDGSTIQVTGFEESSTQASGGNVEGFIDGLIAEEATFALNVTLAQAQQEGNIPVIFEGDLSLSVTDLSSEDRGRDDHQVCTGSGQQTECTVSHRESSSLTFSTLDLGLSGEFTQGEDSFVATFSLNATNHGYVQSESGGWDAVWTPGTGTVITQGSQESEETAEQFVAVNFTLDLVAELPGIPEDVSVSLTGDRTALNTGLASLELAWEGKRIKADLGLNGPEESRAAILTITNNAGTTLVWNDSNIEDDDTSIQGVITANGAQQATFAEENEVVIFRYNGGFVESF